MKVIVLSVFDAKAKIYSQPFFASNLEVALRSWKHMCNNPETDVCRFPADFHLCELGTFDVLSGVFEMREFPENHGTGLRQQTVVPMSGVEGVEMVKEVSDGTA